MSTVYRLNPYIAARLSDTETLDFAADTDFRQTILQISAEIKTFSQLSGKTSMFFSSRVNAAHASIVSHAVNRQHVSSRSSVNRMGICVTANVIQTCKHSNLETMTYKRLESTDNKPACRATTQHR